MNQATDHRRLTVTPRVRWFPAAFLRIRGLPERGFRIRQRDPPNISRPVHGLKGHPNGLDTIQDYPQVGSSGESGAVCPKRVTMGLLAAMPVMALVWRRRQVNSWRGCEWQSEAGWRSVL